MNAAATVFRVIIADDPVQLLQLKNAAAPINAFEIVPPLLADINQITC